MIDSPDFERPIRGSRWSDDQSRQALQAIAESIIDATGFDLVGISAVRDDGYLQQLCVVGPEDARAALIDSLAPLEPLLVALEGAEDWGWLKYVRYDKHDIDVDKWGWTSDGPRVVADGVWHPEDILVAPLHSDDGRLIAVLGLDMPRDGLIPDASKRALLDVFARQASRAVVATLERERLAEQIRLAAAAADIVRRATGSMSVEEVLAECGAAIVEGFRADALWIQLVGTEARPVHDDHPVSPPPSVIAAIGRYAEAAWADQQVGVFAPDRPLPVDGPDAGDIQRFLATEIRAESLLIVPLGAGTEYLGWFALSRIPGEAEWSEGEAAVALDIGRDLGSALVTARTFEHEHRLVEELKALADYKSRLVATVSHELRTPLTSIVGYLEMLDGDEGLSESSRKAVGAIQRGSTRLSRVVEDLLVLHRMADGRMGTLSVVDLAPIVAATVDLNLGPAGHRGISVDAQVPADGAPVVGTAHDLEHVVANLVGNAVKYARDGGHVRVTLEVTGGQVVLCCSDDGIGIAAEDHEQVFEEFYRSPDPEAASRSGTGLGLAIVRRVVDQLGGRIELESALGAGSTFRVHLPAASPEPGA
jgi:two-component system, OmpR family, phosphate regulon sensor histidine kinase PhoR